MGLSNTVQVLSISAIESEERVGMKLKKYLSPKK